MWSWTFPLSQSLHWFRPIPTAAGNWPPISACFKLQAAILLQLYLSPTNSEEFTTMVANEGLYKARAHLNQVPRIGSLMPGRKKNHCCLKPGISKVHNPAWWTLLTLSSSLYWSHVPFPMLSSIASAHYWTIIWYGLKSFRTSSCGPSSLFISHDSSLFRGLASLAIPYSHRYVL